MTTDHQLQLAREIIADALGQHQPKHVFLMLSGGNDSLSTSHFAAANLNRPFKVLHINTGIGIPETRQHVQSVCKLYGWDLVEIRAKEDCGQDYEQIVTEFGFPGPSQHGKMYTRLKERCLEKLARDFDGKRIMLISGARKQESAKRMRLKSGAVHRQGRRVWCSPFFNLSNDELSAYRAAQQIPESPTRQKPCMSGECLCGAFAKPGELKEIEFFFPDVGLRLRALEAKVRAAGFPWGWEEGPPAWWLAMQKAKRFGQVDCFPEELDERRINFLCSSCEARGIA